VNKKNICKYRTSFLKTMSRSLLPYLILGYAIYFIALSIAVPPVWINNMIENLKPLLKSLNTAHFVSEYPFPSQILTIYVTFFSIILSAYAIYIIFFIEGVQDSIKDKWRKMGYSKIKIFCLGFGGLVMGWMFPLIYFFDESMPVSRQAIQFFSPSFISATRLLFSAFFPVIIGPCSIIAIKILVTGDKLFIKSSAEEYKDA